MSADAAGAAGRFSLEFVTMLYSATLAMSGFFQNNLLLRKACNSTVPFGLCTDGEAHAQHVVSVIYSWKACIQYVVPVVLIVLSGQWRYSAQRVCSAGPTFADFSLVFFFLPDRPSADRDVARYGRRGVGTYRNNGRAVVISQRHAGVAQAIGRLPGGCKKKKKK